MENFKSLVYLFFSLNIAVIGAMTVIRRPLTSAKITFCIFSSFLLLWNVNESLSLFVGLNKNLFSITGEILQILTFFFLALFALNFPFYRRRDSIPSYFVSFLLGLGFTLIFLSIYHALNNESIPIDSKAKSVLIDFYVYSIFIFVIGISFLKINKSFQKLKSFLVHAVIEFILLLVSINTVNYIYPGYFFANGVIHVSVVNLFYFVTLFYFLIYFKFWEFYPGIFSVFYSREFSSRVMESIASATPEGAKFLKDELWKANKDEGWGEFVDNFWFNIIIDETLDNAVEHGGRRTMDDITVQVYETKSFLDFYIVDRGKGFDPTNVPDPARDDRKAIPAGRGIHIMKKLFNVRWNFLGNGIRVRVRKSDKVDLD